MLLIQAIASVFVSTLCVYRQPDSAPAGDREIQHA